MDCVVVPPSTLPPNGAPPLLPLPDWGEPLLLPAGWPPPPLLPVFPDAGVPPPLLEDKPVTAPTPLVGVPLLLPEAALLSVGAAPEGDGAPDQAPDPSLLEHASGRKHSAQQNQGNRPLMVRCAAIVMPAHCNPEGARVRWPFLAPAGHEVGPMPGSQGSEVITLILSPRSPQPLSSY